MDEVMLSVRGLHVEVGGVEILHGIDITIKYGERQLCSGRMAAERARSS